MAEAEVFYTIDAEKMSVAGCFENHVDAEIYGEEECGGVFTVISSPELLEQYPVKDLLKLRTNVDLPELKKLKGTKAAACKEIFEAIVDLNMEPTPDSGARETEDPPKDKAKGKGKDGKKKKAAKKKDPAKPRLGRYINVKLKEGYFNGMTPDEILADITAQDLDERDAEKDKLDCVRWYLRKLKKDGVKGIDVEIPAKERAKKAKKEKPEEEETEETTEDNGGIMD